MTRADRRLVLPALLLVAGCIAIAAPGCSRQLNDRYTFEHRAAAADFRQQGLYDLRNARLSDALSNFTEAVRVWPSDAESHWNIGRIYLTIGELQRAEQSFARAAAADPDRYGEAQAGPVEFDPSLTDEQREQRIATARALISDRPPPDDAGWVAE